jgi:hypothetical protein
MLVESFMPLKNHILIIIGITLILFGLYALMDIRRTSSSETKAGADDHFVRITRASWGLACNSTSYGADASQTSSESFAQGNHVDNNLIKENNLLQKVSELCNGKPSCQFRVSPEILGTDPAPNCINKVMEVEYRCFSYDRPWIIKVSNNKVLTINCQG